MITGKLWHLLDERSLKAIADAAMSLVTRTGVRVEHEEMLGRLEAAGCRVDRREARCYFKESLIADAIETFRSDPAEAPQVPPRWHSKAKLAQGGSHPHLLEWPSCRRRLATAEDVRDMARLAHVLDEFDEVGQSLTCAEVASPIEPLWNAVVRMETTDKPIGAGEVLHPETIPFLAELGRIYSGGKPDNHFIASCDFAVAPLRYGRRAVECMIEKSRYGVRHAPGTMPISGLSSPVTVAGTAAVAVAELLAGWAIYFLLDPALPASGVVASGSLDMRAAQACFGSPEAILQDVATVEVCRRRFGMSVWMAANYVDCKVPGIRAVYEKMLPLVAAPVAGLGRLFGDGLLSAGQDYSPVQHLLELEFLRGIGRFYEGFRTDETTLATELIDKIAQSTGETFLETEHTGRHFRDEQWYPRWLDRSPWRGDSAEAEEERGMLDRMDAYCRDAVARHVPPDTDTAKLAAARELLRRAEIELRGVSQRA